ncbi:hypothetical protein HDU89_000130 [Geranomyces variabilis]|nr:hypothetical protein HDU89_000130 [Geranomyces variabilis]
MIQRLAPSPCILLRPSVWTRLGVSNCLLRRVNVAVPAVGPPGHRDGRNAPTIRDFTVPYTTLPAHGQSPKQPSPTPPYAQLRYENDMPFLTLQLSTGNQTAFRMAPTKPVSVLLEQIKEEDHSVEDIAVYDLPVAGAKGDGFRWARSTASKYILQMALKRGGFLLSLNGQRLRVTIPTFEERVAPLKKELENVEREIAPLAATKRALDEKAHRSSVRMAWIGLAALCSQFGLMARLTWWEYSWDVMEPISYFLGAGTGILGYMFYVLTSKEYTYETLAQVTVTKHQARGYKRAKFDFPTYLELTACADALAGKIEALRTEYEAADVAELVAKPAGIVASDDTHQATIKDASVSPALA